jgi:CRISPR-associated endoribonuclease Cas6/Csy4 subtype I-F
MKYVDFYLAGEDSAQTMHLLMQGVHGYNAQHEERLALAFPLMQERVHDARGKLVRKATLGTTLRVFGQDSALADFTTSGIPRKLARLGAAIPTAVADIPQGAGAARYVRDRQLEKGFKDGAYARRQQRRAEAAGREYHPHQRVTASCVGVEMPSKSSGQVFMLDIRRETVAAADVMLKSITAYGLCGQGSLVPHF